MWTVDAGRTGQRLINVEHWHFRLGSKEFRAGMQLQGVTLKMNTAEWDYSNSEHKDTALGIFDSLMDRALKLNKPRSKNYRSWSERPNNLVAKDYSFQMMKVVLLEHSERVREKWKTVLQALEGKGLLTFSAAHPEA